MLENPLRTSLGIVLGFNILLCVLLFEPVLLEIHIIAIKNVPNWLWIPPGVLITHIPVVFHIISSRPKVNENYDPILSLIEETRKKGVSEIKIKQIYIRLLEDALKDATLNASTKEQLRSLEEQSS